MGKHDRAKQEKAERNGGYAGRFRQIRCACGHRTSVEGRCVMCGERIFRDGEKRRRVKRAVKRHKEPSAWTR